MLTGICHCGRVSWTLETTPKGATACNCTVCRRYGALWAYGYIGHSIDVQGDTTPYRRENGGHVDFCFCPHCGCLTHYQDSRPEEDGRYWTAVNLRMAEPADVSGLPIRHFDGLEAWKDQPDDGRRVADLWF